MNLFKHIQTLGIISLRLLKNIGELVIFLCNVLCKLFTVPFYIRNFFQQLITIGFYSLPVIGFTAIFTGAVLALQTYTGFSRMHAESSIASVIVISITRELGPVLAGLMLAGRVAGICRHPAHPATAGRRLQFMDAATAGFGDALRDCHGADTQQVS